MHEESFPFKPDDDNDDEQDTVVTLREYLEGEERLEQEALEAFPAKFDECSYSKGYVRQALYVCRTCLSNPEEEVAAICYSCSLSCHSKCDLVELFARRNFKCDCGNGKFKSITLSL